MSSGKKPIKPIKPSNTEVKQQTQRAIVIVNGIVAIVTSVIKWGVIAFIFWQIRCIAEAWAGKETLAKIGINVLGDIRANEWVAYILAGGGLVYGVGKGAVSAKEKGRMSRRIIELEKQITGMQNNPGGQA